MIFWILFFGTIIPIIFLFAVIFNLYWYFSLDKERHLIYKGMLIFQFDLYNRKLKKKSNNEKTIFKIINNKNNNWIQFKTIINQIEMKKEDSDLIFKTINLLEKSSQKKLIKIKGLIKDFKTPFLFKFLFLPEAHTSDFILNIKWKSIEETFEKTKIQKIDSKEIINNELNYLGILSFNLNMNVKNATKKINKLFLTLKKRKFKIHGNKEVISLIYMSNKKSKIIKFFEKIKIKLEKNSKKLDLKYLFSATSEHICNKINTNQKYLSLFKLIRYFLIVSKQKNKSFVSKKTFAFDKNNFNFYLKNLNTFKNDVCIKNLVSNYISIKNYKTNKKIIDFAYPTISSNIDKKMFNIFLQNPIYKEELINSHIEYLENYNHNLITNINVNWILKNYKKLKNKKIVYILNIKQIFELEKIKKITDFLQKKGFLFAIEISFFDTFVNSFIKKINPKFIIVKNIVWEMYKDSKEHLFVLLITINKIATKQNIKIIYENPPKDINSKQCRKIGLFFSYNFK